MKWGARATGVAIETRSFRRIFVFPPSIRLLLRHRWFHLSPMLRKVVIAFLETATALAEHFSRARKTEVSNTEKLQ